MSGRWAMVRRVATQRLGSGICADAHRNDATNLAAVHVVSSSEVYVGGDQSALLRFDGSGFSSVAAAAALWTAKLPMVVGARWQAEAARAVCGCW